MEKPKLLDIFQDRIKTAIVHLFRGRHESVRRRMLEGKIRTRPHSPRELRKELEEFLKEDSYRWTKDFETGIIILDKNGEPKKEKCLGRPIHED